MGESRQGKGEALERTELMRNSSQFREVFEKGKVVRGKYVTVFFKGGQARKIGFALKRDLRGAVKRNRVKRRLKEIYRKEKRRIDPRVELVLVADKRTEGLDYHSLRGDLLETLRGAGILKNG